jgi:hypothetical protein
MVTESTFGQTQKGAWWEAPPDPNLGKWSEWKRVASRTFREEDTIVVWEDSQNGYIESSDDGRGGADTIRGGTFLVWIGITSESFLNKPRVKASEPNNYWKTAYFHASWNSVARPDGSARLYGSSAAMAELDFRPVEAWAERCTFPPPRDPPKPKEPDPPPRNDRPREPKDMRCNCRNIEEMLRKIYLKSLEIYDDSASISKIVGCDDPDDPDLPADIENLIDDEKTKANTIPELLAHMVEQLDGVLGQFPVEIKIKDIDPLTEGDQEETVKVPNIAEFLCEIYAQQVDLLQNAVLATAAIPRFASELISIKNTGIQAEAYARCNSGYLAYKMEMRELSVPYAFDFDPRKDKSYSQFLTDTTAKVVVPVETDETAAASLLNQIKADTTLMTAVHMRKPSQIDDLVSSIVALYGAFSLGKASAGNTTEEDTEEENPSDEIKALLKLINDSDFFQTGKDTPRPKATRISSSDIEKDLKGESAWD